jgi:hypothetical protein
LLEKDPGELDLEEPLTGDIARGRVRWTTARACSLEDLHGAVDVLIVPREELPQETLSAAHDRVAALADQFQLRERSSHSTQTQWQGLTVRSEWVESRSTAKEALSGLKGRTTRPFPSPSPFTKLSHAQLL